MILSSVKNRSKAHFILSDGELLYKHSSLVFQFIDGREESIPLHSIDEIYIFSAVNLSTQILSIFSRENITLHIFQRNFYRGTYQPFTNSEDRNSQNSNIFIEQLKSLLNNRKRLYIAKAFIIGAIYNSANNCERHGVNLKQANFNLDQYVSNIKNSETIEEIMGYEGIYKKNYYRCWNLIIHNQQDFNFSERSKRPPLDNINALISYLNTRVYTTTLHEIFKTKLDPRIGYLHESNDREFTLHLDISEIFKPIIADNIIFEILNSNYITKDYFSKNFRFSADGLKRVEIALARKLSETFENISWRDRIRIEVNKLRTYLENGETYKPFIF
jgi:CRISPR-associated protein Cas1